MLYADLKGGVDLLESPPECVKPVPRLKSDFEALKKLTRSKAPPKVVRRRSKMARAMYGFGDSAGKGFGHGIEVDQKLYTSFGQWCASVETMHSNYKELRNLVNAVENAYEKGLLKDSELYLFTDNFVAECTYHNGGLNVNKDLNELVFRLWDLQMKEDFSLFVYHVSGTRMIACGVDGLSRGNKAEGITKGLPMLNYLPIHLSPADRSDGLETWIRSCWNEEALGPLELLNYEGWFERVMDKGNFLWMVPPAAGESAVEQLSTHVHGRPENTHIFLIPRLCTVHYRKQLLKCCDVVLTIDCMHPFWDTNMFEPILMGIRLPLLPPERRFCPWQFKHTKLVEELQLQMRRVQSTSEPVNWDFLREFLLQTGTIRSMPDGVARKLLQTAPRRSLSNSKTKGNGRRG